MEAERNDFKRITSSSVLLGMRMHYLRKTDTTLEKLASLGYEFDSTTYELRNPYFVGSMIEFPVSLMESFEMHYADIDLDKIKVRTLDKIKRAQNESLGYFTVIFQ